MKDVTKLAKQGWSKAMIHQRTLSLILTLDNFLISGPYILQADRRNEALSDPNVFFIQNRLARSDIKSELDKEENRNILTTTYTYYIMRSFIRGILFGLNPLYQISLFVPCRDAQEISFYKEIISKIDIGGQFFQDRIYWNLESLKRDIMDSRLACLIYADNDSFIHNEWIRQISIETRPFVATFDSESKSNINLSDLVEMRSFLEDMHQKYFSLITEYKKTHFVGMIRSHLFDSSSTQNGLKKASKITRFYSVNNEHFSQIFKRRQLFGDRYSMKEKAVIKNGLGMFKNPLLMKETCNNPDSKSLFEEYEDIIIEQAKVNFLMSREDVDNDSFTKYLCRWNLITLRKCEVLKVLLNSKDSRMIKEKLTKLNAFCYQIKYQEGMTDSDISQCSQSPKSSISEISDSSCCLPVSQDRDQEKLVKNDFEHNLCTSWFV